MNLLIYMIAVVTACFVFSASMQDLNSAMNRSRCLKTEIAISQFDGWHPAIYCVPARRLPSEEMK